MTNMNPETANPPDPLTLYLLDSNFAQCYSRCMEMPNAIASRHNQKLRTYKIRKVYVDVIVPA